MLALTPIFSKIEEELHDARRVHSHGQEEDLHYALIMVIDRVSELSSLLNDDKAQAEIEVQLNVAKSNLQLVIANNEMLEDALKRDSGQSKDVGWRRTSVREEESKSRRRSLDRSYSAEYSSLSTEMSPPRIPQPLSNLLRIVFTGSNLATWALVLDLEHQHREITTS